MPRSNLPGQLELPDTAERAANLARIKAAAPLRPVAPQEPCDLGLFSDKNLQSDLLDKLR